MPSHTRSKWAFAADSSSSAATTPFAALSQGSSLPHELRRNHVLCSMIMRVRLSDCFVVACVAVVSACGVHTDPGMRSTVSGHEYIEIQGEPHGSLGEDVEIV